MYECVYMVREPNLHAEKREVGWHHYTQIYTTARILQSNQIAAFKCQMLQSDWTSCFSAWRLGSAQLLTTYEQETLVYAELFAYNNCPLHVWVFILQWDCPTSSPTKGAVAACLILNVWPAGVHDDIIVIAVSQYHALLVAMYEQESQNHLCILIAQFSWSDSETRCEASRDLAYQ